MTALPKLSDFPAQTYDKLRFGDTDRQGHINNVVFAVMYETGRVSALPLQEAGFSFVIARITIDYRAEIFWPGTVEIGTAVKAIGNSSVTFVQALFQNGICVSTAESVVVRVAGTTHRSTPLSEALRGILAGLQIAA